MSGAASVWNRAPAHGEGWRAAVLDERASLRARCPVSSCGSMILVEEALERSVLVGIVGAGILPAVPDHIQPCAGEKSGPREGGRGRGRGPAGKGRRPRGWCGGCRRRSHKQRRGGFCHTPSGN